MMIQTLVVALAVAMVVGIAAVAIAPSIPALRDWLFLRRSNEPDGSRASATDSAFEAEAKRLVYLKAEQAAFETRTAEREREISLELRELTAAQREQTEAAAELAKQEAALAERERILEQSLADARNAAEAAARIEAREAALAAQEAKLRQQESELADRDQSAAPRDSNRTRAVPSAEKEALRSVESDWWEKQLGGPLPAKK